MNGRQGTNESEPKQKQNTQRKRHSDQISNTISFAFAGFQSYVVLTTEEILLDVENSSRMISYYLITYGLSFTIVAISLGIDPSAYTIKADACVWMEQSYLFYVTFLMPCCVYILVIVCFYIFCVLYNVHIPKYKVFFFARAHLHSKRWTRCFVQSWHLNWFWMCALYCTVVLYVCNTLVCSTACLHSKPTNKSTANLEQSARLSNNNNNTERNPFSLKLFFCFVHL